MRRAGKKEETICLASSVPGEQEQEVTPAAKVTYCTRFERVKVGWLDEEGVREL